MPPIALFSPAFRVDETLAQIRECLEKGWTGVGYKTLDFENAWRDYTGALQAVLSPPRHDRGPDSRG